MFCRLLRPEHEIAGPQVDGFAEVAMPLRPYDAPHENAVPERPPPEGARELLETPYVCYFARLNAMTAQLEPAAEIHWS
jgi:hypothetical protein